MNQLRYDLVNTRRHCFLGTLYDTDAGLLRVGFGFQLRTSSYLFAHPP